MYTKSYLLNQLAVTLGGRVCEEIKYGIEEVTTAGSGDMQRVRDIARRMVGQWGSNPYPYPTPTLTLPLPLPLPLPLTLPLPLPLPLRLPLPLPLPLPVPAPAPVPVPVPVPVPLPLPLPLTSAGRDHLLW